MVALFFFSFLPPVLAHAGLATTDMALTAFLGAAFVSALRWSGSPTWKNALLFGATHRARGNFEILQPGILSSGRRTGAGRVFIFRSAFSGAGRWRCSRNGCRHSASPSLQAR
ncbi:MAG: hypothetical protein WDO73_09405 [Ignavibacteriota bacterium]